MQCFVDSAAASLNQSHAHNLELSDLNRDFMSRDCFRSLIPDADVAANHNVTPATHRGKLIFATY